MATRVARASAHTPARRSGARRRVTQAATKHASRTTVYAHGYVTAKLKEAPVDKPAAKRVLAAIMTDLQKENAKFPAKWKKKYPKKDPENAPKLELSVMEDTPRHKDDKPYGGKDLIMFVAFNPVPWGYDVAHEHIHDLEATINANSNVAAGLGNHFCCYSDY